LHVTTTNYKQTQHNCYTLGPPFQLHN